jgi:D-serine deaminase-like pyridoxal phosphate-dependent protein
VTGLAEPAAGSEVVSLDEDARLERYERLFAGVDAPFAFVDLDAMWANASDMLERAEGKPIRVASKSVRCRPLLRAILDRGAAAAGGGRASGRLGGFRGLLTFTLPESLWLAGHGFEDLLLAYPSAHRSAYAELTRLESHRPPVVMIDSVDQLELIDAAAGVRERPIRACIDLDLSYWIAGGRVKVGAKRSPVRTPEQAAALAREIVDRDGFALVGLMGYEAHIAGLGDRPPGKRLMGRAIERMQRASSKEIARRRAEVVRAVSEVAPLELVNGGGTGSIEWTVAEDAVTEVTAGSGFYAPVLFDYYSRFSLQPAAMFALPVVRKPARSIATALGGGYLASGSGNAMRLPRPYLPRGLELDEQEGAGEVQTPLVGPAAKRLEVGDRVYMRHAKAGELCERFDSLYLVEGRRIVDEVPTYRGEGKAFL